MYICGVADHSRSFEKIVSNYLNMSAFFWWAMQVAAVHISVVLLFLLLLLLQTHTPISNKFWSTFFWWEAVQVAAVHISVVTTRRTLWPLPVLAHTSTKCDGPPHRVTFIFTFTFSRYMSSDTLSHLTSTHIATGLQIWSLLLLLLL